MKFKIGDRVIVIDDEDAYLISGAIGIVRRIERNEFLYINWEEGFKEFPRGGWFVRRFEKIKLSEQLHFKFN